MAVFTLPAELTVLGRAVSRLGPGHDVATYSDSALVVLVLGGVHAVWLRTWWRNLRARASSTVSRSPSRRASGELDLGDPGGAGPDRARGVWTRHDLVEKMGEPPPEITP
jgi:hypothetical protein